MTTAEALLMEIMKGKHRLFQLEQQLREIQLQCQHDFQEEQTHRICRKCKRMESLHY
ncbi:serine protease [Sporosarcina cyprini]|uniref:serine protease n=1 Tax=Sporosarcina cyprini TaxID=2910523 RepID=UPI001EE03D37|nr:serine protease [Sporosarcina cyprini]MCG3089802.1 serine protease [Sporosarcina cyprini]